MTDKKRIQKTLAWIIGIILSLNSQDENPKKKNHFFLFLEMTILDFLKITEMNFTKGSDQ